MATKTVVGEAKQVQIAIELIKLGARLQLLQEETSLSRERLLRLYKEVRNESPSQGMLPYSTDWFISWLPIFTPLYSWALTNFWLKTPELTGYRR